MLVRKFDRDKPVNFNEYKYANKLDKKLCFKNNFAGLKVMKESNY